MARAAVRDGADLVVTAYGQPRLSRAPKLSQDSPAVVPTGIGMWPASDTALVAPWDGEVVRCFRRWRHVPRRATTS